MSLGQNDNAILKLFADEQLRKENAALAAENERLRSASFVTAVPFEQYERVIKAGDSLALLQCGESDEQHKKRCVIAWLAAKEGRNAK